jgi:simple sugar transport system permease protein
VTEPFKTSDLFSRLTAGLAASARSRGLRESVTVVAIALLVSLAIGSVLILLAGRAPGEVWLAMVTRTLGDRYALGQVVYKATSLALTGLAVAVALDAGLFNIGAEGQLTAGVLACACAGAALPDGTPALLAVPICALAAAAAGAAVGAAIGVLRVTRGAHEVITSIMLNAIVGGVALYLGNRFLFHASTRGPAIAPGAELPDLGLAGSAANTSVVIALLAAAAVWWLRARTTWGRAWRVVGAAPDAARATGVAVARTQVIVLSASGALAGLAATNLVMGHEHAFETGLGAGAGFLGISVALLGRSHPVGVVVAALLLGLLSTSGLVIGNLVPKEVTEVMQGVVVLAVACTTAWVRRRDAGAAAAVSRGAP